MSNAIVHVVHCIDTEGPLYEPVSATFLRLKSIFGLDLEPSHNTLARLQRQEIDLGGLEAQVAAVVSPQLLNYQSDWGMVERMLDRIMAPDFRAETPDSFGGGWIYNWHCVDHIRYDGNPRRRDIGYHNIFDFYRDRISRSDGGGDAVHFHFHPIPFSRQANHNGNHWFVNDSPLFELLARRIIQRNWFPSVNRPGFHITRPDSHWFMEQYIPFDYASQATYEPPSDRDDQVEGRFGDWRRAPRNWQPYHPAHDDYQTPGQCRRLIMRCLNVGTRFRLITQTDVDEAFQQARDGLPVIMAVTDHDFRDMAPDVVEIRSMLANAAQRFPDVKFRYCEARDAVRSALGMNADQGKLHIELSGNRVHISSDRPTFGPQPFFAVETSSGQYAHDNLAVQEPFRSWSFIFDEHTVPMEAITRIGVGGCFANGSAYTAVVDARTGTVTETAC